MKGIQLSTAGDTNRKIKSWIIALIILMLWISNLYDADSMLSSNIICAFVGLLAYIENSRRYTLRSKREKVLTNIFSCVFSLSILMANYKLITPVRENVIKCVILFIGSYFIAYNILQASLRFEIPKRRSLSTSCRAPKVIFLWCFAGISIVYLVTLFFCYMPGILSPDSIFQINCNYYGILSNHHPFWHTMLIKVMMKLGMMLFNDINSAVAVYSVFQMICMAAVFSYVCMTLYQREISSVWIIITAVSFAIIPYHLLYSMTMWKDVLFGGSVTVFVCALYRIITETGRKKMNYAILSVGALGSCLLRSNGFFAFVLTFIILCVLFAKTRNKILWLLLSVIVIAFVLKYPVLNAIGVEQPDTVEKLSIPVQQIAKLIVEDVELEDEEFEQIQRIMNVEKVKERYLPYISDPVKNIIRDTNQEYLSENLGDYFRLWLRLGMKYPHHYIKAWIDQTRGYWNAGYNYWWTTDEVWTNDFGIKRTAQHNILSEIITGWVNAFGYQLPRSIGLHVWVIILCLAVQTMKKKEDGVICILPISIILTLLISTPVFCEFRYAYSIFTTFPFIVLMTFTEPLHPELKPSHQSKRRLT